MHMLIVSDDQLFARVVLRKLVNWGNDAVIESTGTAAFERIKKEPFRVVVMGWDLGGMTGPELCRKIRELKRERYTYLIIYTSRSDADSMRAGLEAGADDYLTRPFKLIEFKLRLQNGKRMLNLEDELREGAGTDSATGLVNDASFQKFFRVVLAETRRLEGRGALMHVRVDEFKPIFAEHGYVPAQTMMVEISKALNRSIRNSDLVARVSEDEFCMLLQNTYWDMCSRVADKVMGHIDNMSIVIDGLEMHPKVTIGTINYPEENLSSDEILALTARIPYER